MRITLTGATGFLGRRLTEFLQEEGHELRILTRRPAGRPGHFEWDPLAGPPPAESLAGSEAVIHLAGEPVAQRWSLEARERIRASRVTGTRHLVEGIGQMPEKPEVLVSASAIGYYGSRGDEILTEQAGPGTGFLPEVCVEWEAAADGVRTWHMREVKLRFGVVLGREGGALRKMLPAFRCGLGGPLAGGRQWMSWIHATDAVRLITWAAKETDAHGAMNAVSPHPVRNKEFTKALGHVLRRPAFFPVPGVALRVLFGEMSEVLTGSQRALPHAAMEQGFHFQHGDVVECLDALLY